VLQLFTAAPPLAMGLFDRLCSADSMMSYPSLYKISQSGKLFSVRVFWVWIGNALVHSILLYWLPLLAFEQDVVWSNGRDGGYLVLGNTVYSVSSKHRIYLEALSMARLFCSM
jgi:phospholipid-transporting ATPase